MDKEKDYFWFANSKITSINPKWSKTKGEVLLWVNTPHFYCKREQILVEGTLLFPVITVSAYLMYKTIFPLKEITQNFHQ